MELNIDVLTNQIGYKIKDSRLYFNNKLITQMCIPEGITKIGKSCFSDILNLEKIVLPESLLVIDSSAFESCDDLKEVVFNKNLEIIFDSAFLYTSLENVVLPENLKYIGKNSFAYIKNLKSVEFLGKDTIIESRAFMGDFKLKNIKLPENLKTIKLNTFFNCASLEEITLKNVKEIQSHAFFNNINLKKIVFPSTLTYFHPNFLDINNAYLPSASEFGKNTYTDKKVEIINMSDIDSENFSANPRIILKNCSLDVLIETGKSFKEINNIVKDIER